MNQGIQPGADALEIQSVCLPGRLTETCLSVGRGLLVGLVGPNGSGKSTLLQVAAGILPSAGRVLWEGCPLHDLSALDRGRRTAWVPQEARFEFAFSVRSVVAQGRFAHGDEDDDQGVEAALGQLDLLGLADRPVNRLSGGERHRVLLARALATGARIQLWDEPLAALDPRHSLELLGLATRLVRGGATVLLSLHDLGLAHSLDRLAVLDRGRLRAYGPPEEVLTEALLLDVFGVRIREGEGRDFVLP